MKLLKWFSVFIWLTVMTPGLTYAQNSQVDSLINLLKTAPEDTARVNILINLAEKIRASDMKAGLNYANEALVLSKKINWDSGKVLTYIKIASIDRGLMQFPAAMDVLDTALPISKQLGNKYLEAKIYLNIANIYRELSQSSKSLDYIFKCQKIAEQFGYLDLTASSYSYLGYIYYTIGDYKKTLEYNFKSLNLDIARHEIGSESIDLSNIGAMYGEMHDSSAALAYMMRGLAISKKVKNITGITNNLANLASILRENGNYVAAMAYADSCLYLSKEAKLKGTESLGLLEKGEIYSAMRQFKNSLIYDKMALQMSAELGLMDRQRDILLAISVDYDSLKEPVKAYETYRKYITIKDTLLKQENLKDITQKEMQFDFDEKEAVSKARQEKRDLIARQEIEKSSLERNIFIAGALLIGAVAVFMLFTMRRLRKLNTLLSLQKDEISAEKEKSEQLGKVKDKLFSIISHDLRSPLVSMDAVLELLNSDELSEEKLKLYTSELSQMLRQNMELLDNLLYWATTQMRGMKINKKNIDVNSLIDESVGLIKGAAMRKHINVNVKAENGIAAFADGGTARLVLRNLMSNAVKFTPEGGEINISAQRYEDEVKIRVADNGVGMSRELIASLLSGETNESLPGTNKEKGFGIGLKLCKEFAEENGGKLEVESLVGHGSTISFMLPLAQAETATV